MSIASFAQLSVKKTVLEHVKIDAPGIGIQALMYDPNTEMVYLMFVSSNRFDNSYKIALGYNLDEVQQTLDDLIAISTGDSTEQIIISNGFGKDYILFKESAKTKIISVGAEGYAGRGSIYGMYLPKAKEAIDVFYNAPKPQEKKVISEEEYGSQFTKPKKEKGNTKSKAPVE